MVCYTASDVMACCSHLGHWQQCRQYCLGLPAVSLADAIAAELLNECAGNDARAQKRLCLGSQTKASLFSSSVRLLAGLM